MVGGRVGGLRRRGDSSCPRFPQARTRFFVIGLLLFGFLFLVWPQVRTNRRSLRRTMIIRTAPRLIIPATQEERPSLKLGHHPVLPEEGKENDKGPLDKFRWPSGPFDPKGDSSDPLEKDESLSKQAKASEEERKDHEDQDHRGDSKDPINAVERPHDPEPRVNNDPRGDSKDPAKISDEKQDEESPSDSPQNSNVVAKKNTGRDVGALTGLKREVSLSPDAEDSKIESKKGLEVGKETESKSVGVDSAEDHHKHDKSSNSKHDELTDNEQSIMKAARPVSNAARTTSEPGLSAKKNAGVKEAPMKAGDVLTENHMHVEQADLEKSRKWDGVQGPHPNSAIEEANSEHMKERLDQTHAQYKWLEGKVTAPTVTEQQATVQKMIKHAWDSYAKHAWGSNELQPVLQAGKDDQAAFGSVAVGASLLEALDTLYLAGLKEEYWRGRHWVAKELQFSKMTGDVSLSEVTTRLLGSLLSMYALSGDEIYKERALDLSRRILSAFPRSALPHISNTLNQRQLDKDKGSSPCFLLAEYGSFHLEFAYLSQMTHDSKYLDTAERVRDMLSEPRRAKLPGMPATQINADTGESCNSDLHLDSGADTYYEYLIKSYLQSRRRDVRALKVFAEVAQSANKHLLKVREVGRVRYHYLARNGTTKMSHAACYAGGMFALAAATVNRTKMKEIGEALALTCHEMYSQTPSKLGAEEVKFHQGTGLAGGSLFDIVNPSYQLRPEAVESYFVLWRQTHNQTYRDWAWEVAQAIEKHCRTDNGYVAVKDVNHPGSPSDGVQHASFLAATLKYLYLIFTNDSVLPLDKWVFNTEAHPLPVSGAFGEKVSGLMKQVANPSVNQSVVPTSPAADSRQTSKKRGVMRSLHTSHGSQMKGILTKQNFASQRKGRFSSASPHRLNSSPRRDVSGRRHINQAIYREESQVYGRRGKSVASHSQKIKRAWVSKRMSLPRQAKRRSIGHFSADNIPAYRQQSQYRQGQKRSK